MAKIVQTVWVRRPDNADVSDLRALHRQQFPGNELAIVKDGGWQYVKVALAIGATKPTGADYTTTVRQIIAAREAEFAAQMGG